jgi:hypothetical protein
VCGFVALAMSARHGREAQLAVGPDGLDHVGGTQLLQVVEQIGDLVTLAITVRLVPCRRRGGYAA